MPKHLKQMRTDMHRHWILWRPVLMLVDFSWLLEIGGARDYTLIHLGVSDADRD